MESSGLTPFALVFMSVSMLAVTALMVWCFWRILSGGDHRYDEPGPVAPESAGGGGTSTR